MHMNTNVWVQHFNAVGAPFNILNIYKEWVGTSWPYTQLQAFQLQAIRTAKVFEICTGLANHIFPKRFLSNLREQFASYSMHMHTNVWVQQFNAVCIPLKPSECLQGMSWDQLTICAAARSKLNGQSLWELGSYSMHMNIYVWVHQFNWQCAFICKFSECFKGAPTALNCCT